MWTKILQVLIGLGLLFAAGSCIPDGPAPAPAPVPPPLEGEPVGVQVVRAQPSLAGMPFRVLLDFEKPVDLAFISPSGLSIDSSAAHTGRSSLAIAPERPVAIKLTSLSGDAPFPGNWTLAGAYFRSDRPARITAVYQAGASALARRTVEIAPGRWTGVWLDLANAPAGFGVKSLVFTASAEARVFCDDVIIADNTRILERPAAAAPQAAGWTVRQRGFSLLIDQPGRFRITAQTPEASAEGWNCEEANEIRVRLAGASGKVWTIYSDGRQYQNGQCSLLYNPRGASMARSFAEQHNDPADVEVAEEFGRLDRTTAGDRLNDGYNELRGAYQFVARGARFEARLSPRSAPLIHPVLEIAKMPPGRPTVTIEGELIERVARLSDGTLLVEVPITVTRPTTVSITVK